MYNTKKKNNSFNKSKSEKKVFEILSKIYYKIKRQYKDTRYPFACDFYIPEKDLFLECNFHWTHGKEPFDKNNKEHIKLLKLWESKDTKYYNRAIKTWTDLDVRKRKIADKNDINFIEFFNFKEAKERLNC